jgi:hypothetical protein
MYCNSILLIHSNMPFSPISLSSSLNCYWAPGLKSTLAGVMAQFGEACPGREWTNDRSARRQFGRIWNCRSSAK